MSVEVAELSPRTGRQATVLAGLALLLVGACVLRLCVGQTFGIPEGDFFSALRKVFWGQSVGDDTITVMDLRVLRLVMAVLVGIALSASGVALQALLRNPLAEPFILGLSSGAALGMMAQWLLVYLIRSQVQGGQLGALVGAAASAAVVYLASRRRGMVDPLGLLLTGVVLSTVSGSFIMLLNYLMGPAGLREDVGRWMMGYINENASAPTVVTAALVIFASLALVWGFGRAMDLAGFADAEAMSMGLNLAALRTVLFVVASTLAAAAVVLAGPIGFVGLICPHLARLILGPRHRPLLIASSILGATLVVLADTLAVALDRWLSIGIMPVGVFTAMIGGPAFLVLLHPQLGRGRE